MLNTSSTSSKMQNMLPDLLHFDTAESFLGDPKKRYFSYGYKRVEYDFDDIRFTDGKLTGLLSVEWSVMWAQKQGAALAPHLGSLEFYVIAAQMAELYLEMMENFSDHDLANTWISHFKIKAGAKAETVLAQEECVCRKSSKTTYADNGTDQSFFDVKIGGCTVQLTLDHLPILHSERQPWTTVRKTQSPHAPSYFRTGYKIPVHRIANIGLDTQKRSAKADIEIANQELLGDFRGLGQTYHPCFSYADAILIVGQLSQILLFSLDGLTRDGASNLWMRQIETAYRQPLGDKFTVELRADEFKMVKLKESTYRTADLHLNCADQMTAKLKFAYQL